MMFLLGVAYVAYRFGRGPAIAATDYECLGIRLLFYTALFDARRHESNISLLSL